MLRWLAQAFRIEYPYKWIVYSALGEEEKDSNASGLWKEVKLG